MAYPALPTHPRRGIKLDPTTIHSGDEFSLNGYHYKAVGNASLMGNYVRIPANTKHLMMPSGWECADVLEPLDSDFYSIAAN